MKRFLSAFTGKPCGRSWRVMGYRRSLSEWSTVVEKNVKISSEGHCDGDICKVQESLKLLIKKLPVKIISFRQLWPTSLEGKPCYCRQISIGTVLLLHVFWPGRNFCSSPMISALIPRDFRKRTWSNINETRMEIARMIDFAHFGLTMSKNIGADRLKNQRLSRSCWLN